jgi:hypothetical protein
LIGGAHSGVLATPGPSGALLATLVVRLAPALVQQSEETALCGDERREGREGSVADPSLPLVRCEDELWQKFSDRNHETLENDTEKQQKKDAEVMERQLRVHDPSEDVTAGHAAQGKAKGDGGLVG